MYPYDQLDAPHCTHCRFWGTTKYFDLDRASERNIDAGKCLAEVMAHRLHTIKSEAHFHAQGKDCTERCVA